MTCIDEIISSLNSSELKMLILKLTERDVSLSDRIIGIVRQISPYSNFPKAPQWQPKEILAEANRILNLERDYTDYHYAMEGAGYAFGDLLDSLEDMFQICSKAEMVQSLQGLTEMVAKNLDDIKNGCDEDLPWQYVAEHLGKYWLQLASREDVVEVDCRAFYSFLSKGIPQFEDYGLDEPFHPAIKIFENKRGTGEGDAYQT